MKIAAIIVVAVAVIAGAATFATHSARVRARQAQLDHILAVRDKVRKLALNYSEIGQRYYEKTTDGSSQGERRHNAAVNGTDDSTLLTYAKAEAADVDAAEDLNTQITTATSLLAGAYSSLYSDVDQRFQSDVAQRNDACAQALGDWDRAISDIRDSLQASVDGRFLPAGNAEQYYSASDHEEIQCDRRIATLDADFDHTDARIAKDLSSVQTSLNGF